MRVRRTYLISRLEKECKQGEQFLNRKVMQYNIKEIKSIPPTTRSITLQLRMKFEE